MGRDRLITNDCYFTPPEATQSILNQGILRAVTSILEPAAGNGAIIKVLNRVGYSYRKTAIEVNPALIADLKKEMGEDQVIHKSFLHPDINPDTIGKYDLVITNPPFSVMPEYIEKCQLFLNETGKLVLLLRLAHLVGVKRTKLFEKYKPSQVYLLMQRPKFQSFNSTDIGGYCWVVWENPITSEDTTLHWITDHRPRKEHVLKRKPGCTS